MSLTIDADKVLYGSGIDCMGMSFTDKPTKGLLKLTTDVHTCREGIVSSFIKKYMTDIKKLSWPAQFRLFIIFPTINNVRNEKVSIGVSLAKKVLNILEKEVGWGKTNIFSVNVPDKLLPTFKTKTGTLFIASQKWLSSQYLISLYTLIIRMCILYSLGTTDKEMPILETWNDVVKFIEKNDYRNIRFSNIKETYSHVKKTYKFWLTILKNRQKLFGSGRTPKKESFTAGSSFKGITALCEVAPPTLGFELTKHMLDIKKHV